MILTLLGGLGCSFLLGEITIRILSSFLPSVNYLALAGVKSARPVFHTFEEFVRYPEFHLVPHGDWNGYASNRYGFNDREFEQPKPSGRTRVLAIGDSFDYGLVAYPDNVLTLTEASVRERCPNIDFDLLNLGIPATGVWEYKTLLKLAAPLFRPDIVLVNFYLGNDGPDTFERKDDLPPLNKSKRHSYLISFLKNAWILLTGGFDTSVRPASTPETITRSIVGGERLGTVQDLSDDAPPLKGPTFTGEAWLKIARTEMNRFYSPKEDPTDIWARTLDTLQELVTFAKEHQIKLVFVFYPSRLQLDKDLRGRVIERLNRNPPKGQIVPLSQSDFDPSAPANRLFDFCKTHTLSCFDLSPSFLGADTPAPEAFYISQDTHWNKRGNTLAAESQADILAPFICGKAPQ